MAPHSAIRLRLGIGFLLALFAGLPARAQSPIINPSIKMTVSPGIVEPGQDFTFTITVESTQRFKAAVWDPIPGLTKFASVQHSGSNVAADKCTEQKGLSPYTNIVPGVSRGTSVLCPIPFPGTETITLVVTALNPGIVTNTAALIWETNTTPPHTEHITASASAIIDAGIPIFANFGIGLPCLAADLCIRPDALAVNGADSSPVTPPPPANTMAVSFTPAVTLRLNDIQIPFAVEPASPNDFFVWITTDSSGFPGTVLEKIHETTFPAPVPQSPFAIVTIINSQVHPTLTANTKFWLVIGPGQPTVFGAWNLAQSDPVTSTNFLISETTSVGVMPLVATHSWQPANPTFPARLAFEIDGKP